MALNWLSTKKESDKPENKSSESVSAKKQTNQETTKSSRYFLPDVDIFEKQDTLVLKADVPGINKNDVKISVDNNLLTIEADIDLSIFDGLKPIYSEYKIGNYQRQFQLGQAIDTDKISAEIKDGVLTLDLPKKEKKQAVQIQIK